MSKVIFTKDELLTLTPTEEKVLRMRFGIDDDKYTLEAIGAEFGLGRERIRQIEAKALNKLKGASWRRFRELRKRLPKVEG